MNTSNAPHSRPLEDITVLDLTTALAGPYATLILAGLGARVIKIENPLMPDSCRTNAPYLGASGATLTRQHADDISVSELNRLRNKLGVTLNLKKPAGRAVFDDLLKVADVVVENFSRGALDRMGVGYAHAREINPRVIYCSITGFGLDSDSGTGKVEAASGGKAEAASGGKAMDAIIQALSGVMLTSGDTGDPPVRVGVPFADLTTPLFGIIGLLAALHQAQKSGVGQQVDVSMLGVMTSMVACEPFDLLERCGVPQRTGLTVPRLAPFGIYRTADGFVAICAPTETFAAGLFPAMGKPEMASDPRFRTRDDRVRNVRELDQMIEEFTTALTSAKVIARLEAAGVPVALVRNPDAAVRDPRVTARRETVRLAHPKYGETDDVYGMGLPIQFSAAQCGYDQPAPALGEHNQSIFGGLLGYSEAKIQQLRAEGVL